MQPSQSPDRAIELLKTVTYFSGLNESALKLVAQSAVRRVYSVGQVIFLEGEPCPGLFIVENGWLKVVKIGVDGREQVLQTLGAGDVFNAISVFTDAPNQATVTSLEPSTVWIVLRDSLLTLLDKYPLLARQVVKDLAGRVIHLIKMVEDLSLRSVEARLARLILEQSDGETFERQRWATQAELAARLGTVPDVVNRALRKLVDEGMIRVERHQIEILNQAELRMIAQLID